MAATLIALLSAHAHAECILLQPEKSFTLPEILNLPPDIDPTKPKQISDWHGLSDTAHPQFQCTSHSKISLRLHTDSGTSATGRNVIAGDGQTYTAFDYAAGFPALRMIVQYRYRLNDGPWSAWQPLNDRSANVPRLTPPTDSTNLTVDERMAFLAGPGHTAGHWTNSLPLTVSAQMDGTPAVTSRFDAGRIDIAAASCTTSNAALDMGAGTALAKLPGIGSHTPLQSFALALNRCPAGFGNIQYQWDPATKVLDNTQGLAAPDNASSASGIGLQVADAAEHPIAFGQRYTFGGQDRGEIGSYAIPLKAAYYRTGNVKPGSANTVVTFTLNYP